MKSPDVFGIVSALSLVSVQGYCPVLTLFWLCRAELCSDWSENLRVDSWKAVLPPVKKRGQKGHDLDMSP
jgi:hypothetical protein